MRRRFCLLFCFYLQTNQQAFAAEKAINLNEINLHNSANNCWIIVDTKVYDITKFTSIHDTMCGKMKLTDLCGKDASAIWLAKQKSDHAHKTKSVLEFERSQIGVFLKP